MPVNSLVRISTMAQTMAGRNSPLRHNSCRVRPLGHDPHHAKAACCRKLLVMNPNLPDGLSEPGEDMNANTESKTAPRAINGRIRGRFAPGHSGNPGGSPEATRRAFNKRFLLDLAEDWQQHGREVFKRVRRESPASYLKVCAMLVPREMKVEHSGGVKAMTDEQIEAAIEMIQGMLAAREAGADAKVIEGEAEVVPSLPAPGSGGTKMPKV